jgi:hypothetical protein
LFVLRSTKKKKKRFEIFSPLKNRSPFITTNLPPYPTPFFFNFIFLLNLRLVVVHVKMNVVPVLHPPYIPPSLKHTSALYYIYTYIVSII